MRFTVAICTWNRATLLARALDRLTRIHAPRGGWELIVVNNASTDDTESVIASFAQRLPLRSVFEPRPGLSHARNTASADAAGDYIAWTDDDALVSDEWLAAYERAIESHPNAAFFGGPVHPLFEGTVPAWIPAAWPDIRAAFAERDLGDRPFEFRDDGELPYGVNFVVRASEQRKFPYDAGLGRRLEGGAVGEETAVIRGLLTAGSTGWWVPEASVEHCIPKERQSIKYLRRYYRLQGKTHYDPTLRARSLYLWQGIIRAELAYSFGRLTGDPQRWVKPLIRASTLRGSFHRRSTKTKNGHHLGARNLSV